MRITFIDVENTITKWTVTKRNGETQELSDISPYRPNNKLVSVGLWYSEYKKVYYYPINHISILNTNKACVDSIQGILNETDLLVAHNMKHDLAWLWEAGFTYNGDIWCTQVAEYIHNRGVKSGISLKALGTKYNLSNQKIEVEFDWEHLDKEPWDLIKEYGTGDIKALRDLFKIQYDRYATVDHGLLNTMTMSMDFLKELIHMEKNGAHIDLDELAVLEKEYIEEYNQLDKELHDMARRVMGDTPIRLSSPDFRSELLFSRKVKDKNEWKRTFNIGLDARGKKKLRPNFKAARFRQIVRNGTDLCYKTTVKHCGICSGIGSTQQLKKDGSQKKLRTKCKNCEGQGFIYTATGKSKSDIAGFKLSPRGVKDTAAGGFVTDADTLEQLIGGAKGEAKEFLTKWSRHNAISTYLDTFVAGIRKFTDGDRILRTQLNQTITFTGRLSSTAPNLHNQPRGNTFPVRRVFTSRFPGGKIIKADFSTLEYRTAGLLAGCSVVLNAINTKEDVHAFTRDTFNAHPDTLSGEEPEIDRQDSKPHTFKPLYGGKSGTNREKHYYSSFIEKHPSIKAWHESLLTQAVSTKVIKLPSGREYRFPYAERTYSGYVMGSTQVVNYPVQGFATADLVPIAVIAVGKAMRAKGLKSVLFLTVHDEVDIDVYPGEENIIIPLVIYEMLSILGGCKKYYGLNFKWPFGCEVNMGDNWLQCEEVAKGEINYKTGKIEIQYVPYERK